VLPPGRRGIQPETRTTKHLCLSKISICLSGGNYTSCTISPLSMVIFLALDFKSAFDLRFAPALELENLALRHQIGVRSALQESAPSGLHWTVGCRSGCGVLGGSGAQARHSTIIIWRGSILRGSAGLLGNGDRLIAAICFPESLTVCSPDSRFWLLVDPMNEVGVRISSASCSVIGQTSFGDRASGFGLQRMPTKRLMK